MTPTSIHQANTTWETLLQVHAVMMRRFDNEGTWTEVSMREYDVLYALSKSDEPLRPGDLTDHVLLSQPALSRLVGRLVDRGLVARDFDDADRRSVRLSLTEAGRHIQRRVGRAHARSVAAAMGSALEHTEMAALQQLLDQLSKQLRRECDVAIETATTFPTHTPVSA